MAFLRRGGKWGESAILYSLLAVPSILKWRAIGHYRSNPRSAGHPKTLLPGVKQGIMAGEPSSCQISLEHCLIPPRQSALARRVLVARVEAQKLRLIIGTSAVWGLKASLKSALLPMPPSALSQIPQLKPHIADVHQSQPANNAASYDG